MGKNNNTRVIELEDVKSKYTGEHYIGFVLDALNLYLGWEKNIYDLSHTVPSWRAKSGMVDSGNGKKISIWRRKDKYIVIGFPDEADWWGFRGRAGDLVDKLKTENEWAKEIVLKTEKKYWEKQKEKQRKV